MSDAGLRGGRSRPRNMEPYGDMGDQEIRGCGIRSVDRHWRYKASGLAFIDHRDPAWIAGKAHEASW